MFHNTNPAALWLTVRGFAVALLAYWPLAGFPGYIDERTATSTAVGTFILVPGLIYMIVGMSQLGTNRAKKRFADSVNSVVDES